MRKIKVEIWKEKEPGSSEEKDVSIISIIKILINNRDPQKIPRGIDQHRFYGRLAKCFDKAEETGSLEIEEADYSMIKKIVEAEVPAAWGMNKDINQAVESFLNAESE